MESGSYLLVVMRSSKDLFISKSFLSSDPFMTFIYLHFLLSASINTKHYNFLLCWCTGSFLCMVRKLLLISPKIWVPVTSWGYWGLTRCGPFDNTCHLSIWVTYLGHYCLGSKLFICVKMQKLGLFCPFSKGVIIFDLIFLSQFITK